MNPEQFRLALKEKGFELTDVQMNQFDTYYKTLVEWNEKVNLTAITEENEVYLKHFYDSITPAFHQDLTGELMVCDVGAGAGFPSIPLKIVFPNLKVTIVDSLQKRIVFLNHLATALGLDGVSFYHDRAETFGKNANFRESFDIVTARAVARMSVLSELCLPLVKKDGMFIALKGAQAAEELEKAKDAIELFGGEITAEETFTLPQEDSERTIYWIRKRRKTPKKYPRKPGVPNKNPIE